MKNKILVIGLIMLGSIVNAQNFNWTAQTSNTSEHLRDVVFIDDMTGWTVGNNGTILNTTDGGDTWSVQLSGVTIDL